MKTSEKKEKKRIAGWIYPFLILSVFFISFSASAFIFMNSSGLVFSSNEKELKSLTEKLGKKDEEITELKYQLERYKALYEKELSENEPPEIKNN